MMLPPGVRHPAEEQFSAPTGPAVQQIEQALQQEQVRQATRAETGSTQQQVLAKNLLAEHLNRVSPLDQRVNAQALLANVGPSVDGVMTSIGML